MLNREEKLHTKGQEIYCPIPKDEAKNSAIFARSIGNAGEMGLPDDPNGEPQNSTWEELNHRRR